MTVNTVSKEILARLLSQENLDVTHENVQTASFDVLNRSLTLPMWDNMEDYTYDHLVGHEVGHALYTPSEGWMEEVEERGQAFKSFLNVVEDARIEKLIQRRFPGLRRSFVRSYQKMLADDFFGANVDDINSSYELIDRLNVLFKCGESIGIRIEEDEKVWVDELRGLETFDDALDCAIRLFEAMTQKKQEEQNEVEQEIPMPSPEAEDNEDTQDDGEEIDADGADGETKAEDEAEAEDTAAEQQPPSDYGSGSDGATEEMPVAKTDQSLEEAIRDMSDTKETVITAKIDTKYWDGVPVIKPARIAKDLAPVPSSYKDGLMKRFNANNKTTINYLVKEFEMKKRAAEYARTTTSKSGVIDTVKMNNYKFSDDIFSRVGVVPDGKNHGMILYLDWSGSMYQSFSKTVEQCLSLAMFCRQVNIPFKVLGFSDGANLGYRDVSVPSGYMAVSSNMCFIELLSNELSRSKFTEAAKNLLALGELNSWNKTGYRTLNVGWEVWQKALNSLADVHGTYRLNSTPLDNAIIAGIKIHNKFKVDNRLDIVNAIFLTDGCSNRFSYNDGCHDHTRVYSKKLQLKLRNQRFMVDSKEEPTNALLEIYGQETGSNVIGMRIVASRDVRGYQLARILQTKDYAKVDELSKDFRKNKWMSFTARGYDKSFLILDTSLKAENGEFEVDADATKGKIKSAFSKSMSKRLTSRKMLTEFIDMVA